MFDGFFGAITMRLIGKKNQSDRTAVSPNSLIQAIALDRERAGIIVGLAVDQENRFFNLVGIHERRHSQIRVLSFPERAALALESKGRQRAVVSAALGD